MAEQSETQRQIEDQRRRVQEETDRLVQEAAAKEATRAAEEWK